MRIGEIAVVGPNASAKREFIRNVSDEIVVQTDDLIFGRLRINNQLVVHLYGVNYSVENNSPLWDLVSQKLLGYVVLFNWSQQDSYIEVQKMVDSLSSIKQLPIVIAANVPGGAEILPPEFLEIKMNLQAHCEFTFCDVSNVDSVKKILVTLVDAVIEKIA